MAAIQHSKQAVCILGAAGCGKTTTLLSKAVNMAQSTKDSVLVLCANARSAKASAKKLEHLGAPDTIEVLTGRELALEIMADDAVIADSRRRPVVLSQAEEKILFEDLRPLGIKGRRLHELCNFLYRGWCDLADDDNSWIMTTEEEAVIKLIKENLNFTGGILCYELSNLAVNACRKDKALVARHTRAHIYVDDFCFLTHATQALASLLAVKSTNIAADPASSIRIGRLYPYAAGVSEFLKVNPNAELIKLKECWRPQSIGNVLKALRNGMCMSSDEIANISASSQDKTSTKSRTFSSNIDDAVSIYVKQNLSSEMRTIVSLVKKAKGKTNKRILIVGTNKTWRANIARVLKEAGISCIQPQTNIENETQTLSVERLAHDTNDSLAWRDWLSIGDYMGRSVGVRQLRNATLTQACTLSEALVRLKEGLINEMPSSSPITQDMLASYQAGLIAAKKYQPLRPSNTCQEELFEQENDRTVLICSPDECFGRNAELVIFGAFVNGFIPVREYFYSDGLMGTAKNRELERCVKLCYLVAACATEKLVFTGFTQCKLETAERLHLRIARIASVNGARCATVEPSMLLEIMNLKTKNNPSSSAGAR